MTDINENNVPTPEQKTTPEQTTTPQTQPTSQQTPTSQTQPTQQKSGWYNPYTNYQGYSIGYTPHTPTPEQPKKKKPVWIFVILGILGVIVLLSITLASIFTSMDDTSFITLPETGDNYVAVLYIDAEIAGDYVTTSMYGSYSSYDQVFYLDTIEALIEDEYNLGIMLYINSPGGEVTATDEFSRAIVEYKEKTGRPVYAYFADFAASGAYWIGAHTDKIIAHKFCTTGSIGVTYGTHIEISELLSKLGVKVTELTAGDNKAMGSMYSPLTDEQKAMYEEQLSELHEMFIDVVAEGRGLNREEVKKIADGRTFLASKALEYKLIDEIGYFEDAQRIMAEDCAFSEEVVFYDCIREYDMGNDLMMYFYESYIKEKTVDLSDDEAVAALIEKLADNRRFMAIYR